MNDPDAAEQRRPEPPADPYAAFAPSGEQPWDARLAGHVLRRGGFAPTPARMKLALERGPGGTVDWLLDFDPAGDVGGFAAFLDQAAGLFDVRRSVDAVVDWWYHRIMHTPHPLQERVALMWHNHFATSAAKVGNAAWMHNQIELFRTKGLGSFRDLVVAVGRDPAMLRWLDGNNSAKSGPNENYAREVMELFTLGVDNGYTEDDIKQLSRCFTGWAIEGNEGKFKKDRFDDGEKTVFGQTGKWDDAGAVDVILARPPATRFVARRLLTEFVHPEPMPEHVEHYAGRLAHHKWDVAAVLREMLGSRLFFGDWAWRSKIKSPVELVAGAAMAVGGVPRSEFLRRSAAKMGQALLMPPDVSGWTGGEAWINANTVMLRFNFAMELSRQGFGEFAKRGVNDLLREREATTAVRVVNYFGELLLDGRMPAKARGRLLDYMHRNDKNEPSEFEFNYNGVEHKVRGMIHLMMTMPQYQLA